MANDFRFATNKSEEHSKHDDAMVKLDGLMGRLSLYFACMYVAMKAGKIDRTTFVTLLGGEDAFQEGERILIELGIEAFADVVQNAQKEKGW